MIEEAVNEILRGYVVTDFDIAYSIEHSDALCAKCGECCRRVDPIVVDKEDIMKIASFLGYEYSQVIKKYCKQLEDGRLSLQSPCPFLKGNLCSVHPVKPKVCKLWPLTIQGERITLGIQPYCKFTVNLLTQKAIGLLIIQLIQQEAPDLSIMMKKHAENLAKRAPPEQAQQILFFKKWIENEYKREDREILEKFSKYLSNLFLPKDFLLTGEVIKYKSSSPIKYMNDLYTIYITNFRFIAYKRGKQEKPEIISEKLEKIQRVSYREKGVIVKKGILHIKTDTKTIDFEGKLSDVKRIWHEIEQVIAQKGGELE